MMKQLKVYVRKREIQMMKMLILRCAGIAFAGQAFAQVELKAYADRDGYLDVQKLTCAQLANTFQEDADYLPPGTAVGTMALPRNT
jgi:hypothetical protein